MWVVRSALDTLRGKTVRLQVLDESTAAWGFVSVGGCRLVD